MSVTLPIAAGLLRVVVASVTASVVVSVTFALLIFGVVRSSELHAGGRNGAAAAYSALAICAAAAFAASVIYGIVLMTQKS